MARLTKSDDTPALTELSEKSSGVVEPLSWNFAPLRNFLKGSMSRRDLEFYDNVLKHARARNRIELHEAILESRLSANIQSRRTRTSRKKSKAKSTKSKTTEAGRPGKARTKSKKGT